MIVNTNKWHYQVYSFTYWHKHDMPRQTNLCQYVRRILFMGPIMGACAAVLFCLFVVMIACILVVGPIVGYVPKEWLKPWDVFEGMHKYKSVIYPWHVIVAALFLMTEWYAYDTCGSHQLLVQGYVVGAIALFLAGIFGIFAYGDSDTGKMINAYVGARKQKVCPIVEFKEEE